MNKIRKIYNTLLEHYGAQGWWPVTPIGGCSGEKDVIPVYGVTIKNEKQILEIIIGAILTQNTAWKNVEKAIIELNKKNLIDVNKLLIIKQEELAQTIKSSGYFNQKAKKLKNFAVFLKKYSIKKLKNMELNNARKLLLSINGIGPETADSILLYAFNKPIFVVDAYTKRIFSRIGFKEKTYDEFQALFMQNLEHDAKLFNGYHALIVELGKNICQKKPLCDKCAINNLCEKKIN